MFVSNTDSTVTGGGGVASPSYQVPASLRFRSTSSANLTRTFGTPTTQNTYTLSFWVKRGNLGTAQLILGASTNYSFGFTSGDAIALTIAGTTYTGTPLYRDPSAWYHVVYSNSGTTYTIYVNGVSVLTGTSVSNTVFNSAVAHQIGSANSASYFEGYLADLYFIDGQALTPSSFGQKWAPWGNAWTAISYTGTYGTNGFHLNFSNTSSLTTLAADSSGNGNNWTTNNISLTAGATYDAMYDVPLGAGGSTSNGLGNYATFNPYINYSGGAGVDTLSNANLIQTSSATAATISNRLCTIPVSSGKWYFEAKITQFGSYTVVWVGGVLATDRSTSNYFLFTGCGTLAGNSNISGNGITTQTPFAAVALGDVISCAVDFDAGAVSFYKNNVQIGVTASGIPAGTYCLATRVETDGSGVKSELTVNFGQQPFVYTPPTGFKALHTGNFSTPTIPVPDLYFDALTYTGTGATKSVTNVNTLQPDLVWLKSRSGSTVGKLTDSSRGVTLAVVSSTTSAETTDTGGVTAINANGFTLGTDTNYNTNAATYVAWQWKKSAISGMDIELYTGNGANRTISHSLAAVPNMILIKGRSGTTDWQVYHSSLANTQKLVLDTTAAAVTDATAWNSTTPTSSVFSLGTQAAVNTNAATYVAYLFAAIAGMSAFGSYTGNGSASGSFIYTGFKPRFLLIKCTSTTSSWLMLDTARDTQNVTSDTLFSDTSAAEVVSATLDILSNGFCLKSTGAYNTNTQTYIYAAFADVPFKYTPAR